MTPHPLSSSARAAAKKPPTGRRWSSLSPFCRAGAYAEASDRPRCGTTREPCWAWCGPPPIGGLLRGTPSRRRRGGRGVRRLPGRVCRSGDSGAPGPGQHRRGPGRRQRRARPLRRRMCRGVPGHRPAPGPGDRNTGAARAEVAGSIRSGTGGGPGRVGPAQPATDRGRLRWVAGRSADQRCGRRPGRSMERA